MRVRHRIPSIFTLSMVDVLCCALGCVILLWLLNLREAEEHQREQSYALERIEAERAEASQDATELRKRLTTRESDYIDLDKKLKEALARLLAVQKDLDLSTIKGKEELLRADDLAKRLAAALKQIEALQLVAARLPEMKKEVDKRDLDLEKLNRLMQQLLAAKVKLEKDVTSKDKELSLALVYKDKFDTAEGKVLALTKELADGNKLMTVRSQAVEALLEEKRGLQARALRLQAEVDNRFAGIALTGRRVAFVIDTSGSMERVDPETVAPTKWPEVRNTLARVMRSLQNLEKFQVIVFSNQASHLLGSEGRWLDFDPKTSIDEVTQALARTKPEGGTNMYLGLEAAFKLRDQGLDTVYLLSDGLPNNGPGLSPEESQRLKGRQHEVERGVVLGRHIRRVLKSDWNRGGRIRIHSVGFFYESPDLGAFLWSLSRDNGGSFVGMSNP